MHELKTELLSTCVCSIVSWQRMYALAPEVAWLEHAQGYGVVCVVIMDAVLD